MTSHLRLVPFSPNDYAVGEVLVSETQNGITDPRLIGSAFSLAFQWRDRTICGIVQADGNILPVTMDYDRDERHPSELRIRFEKAGLLSMFSANAEVTVRFEIFRQCYEFSSQILALSESDGQNEVWHLIIDAPSTLIAYKRRRLPRIRVTEEEHRLLPECVLIDKDGLASGALKITEMGIATLLVENCDLPPVDVKFISTLGQKIPAIAQMQGNKMVVFVKSERPAEVQAAFELYRSVVYPNLRDRSKLSFDEVARLYLKSNYLDKFQNSGDVEKQIEELKKVWTCIGGESDITADFVIVDEKEQPSGASSATFSFLHKGEQVWALHQLCALTNPNLLAESGQLYTWRAEYLAARPGPLQVIGWFDSMSRWLERIYVKFAVQKYQGDCIFPISIQRKRMHPSKEVANISSRKVTFGSLNRHMFDAENVFGGLSPEFLNASRALDGIVTLDPKVESNSLEEICQHLIASSEAEEIQVEFTLPKSGSLTIPDSETVPNVDRMFLFAKDGLADFISAVEHSVAVTIRKKAHGEFGEAG